jgi:hypothetical protein
MIWKRVRRAKQPGSQTWKRIDQAPVPLSAGRIWLVDKDGNFRRALGWTWRILNRREPSKYRWWMSRASHAREPAPEAIAALKALQETADKPRPA